MRLLLVEDEPNLALNLQKLLKKNNYAVDIALFGREAVEKCRIEEYDLLILDWMLPDIQGIEVLKKIRSTNNKIPAIFLTAKGELEDKLFAFDIGCDDYLTKPFEFSELNARIKALLKRREKDIIPDIISFADLVINRSNMLVTRAGNQITLSNKEFALLDYLATSANRVIDRNTLLTKIWDEHANPFSRTVDVHIRYLRKKIDDAYNHKFIKTIPSKGYMLCTPD